MKQNITDGWADYSSDGKDLDKNKGYSIHTDYFVSHNSAFFPAKTMVNNEWGSYNFIEYLLISSR